MRSSKNAIGLIIAIVCARCTAHDGSAQVIGNAGPAGARGIGPAPLTIKECLAEAQEFEDELSAARDDAFANYEFFFNLTADLLGFDRFPFIVIDGDLIEISVDSSDALLKEFFESEEYKKIDNLITELRDSIDKVEGLRALIQGRYDRCDALLRERQPLLPIPEGPDIS